MVVMLEHGTQISLIFSGKCEEEGRAEECDEGVVLGKCRTEPEKYKKICRKSCDSCGYGIQGD